MSSKYCGESRYEYMHSHTHSLLFTAGWLGLLSGSGCYVNMCYVMWALLHTHFQRFSCGERCVCQQYKCQVLCPACLSFCLHAFVFLNASLSGPHDGMDTGKWLHRCVLWWHSSVYFLPPQLFLSLLFHNWRSVLKTEMCGSAVNQIR